VYTALEILVLPRKYEQIGSKVIFALVVMVTFYLMTRVVILFLARWGRQEPSLERVTQPAGFVVRVVFALLAGIIIFENLGIHLTAVWTTLGVGSVTVALALQDTLGNFFAGLYLLADHPISPGDYVKLDGGHEGYVSHVGWRSTSFRTLGNNLIVIPNSILTKAVITNYLMPEERMSLDIRVGVAYGTDARRVEKVLVEIAEKAMADGVEGLLAHIAPWAQLNPGFGASTLDFTLNVTVRRFENQFAVRSELRKRILERFQAEGIDMPFPTQTIILDKSTLAPRAPELQSPAESSHGWTPPVVNPESN
jgi:small-conductance mechanosensitive channel